MDEQQKKRRRMKTIMKSHLGQTAFCRSKRRGRRRRPPPSSLRNIVTITIPLVSAIVLAWGGTNVLSSSEVVGHQDNPQQHPEHSQEDQVRSKINNNNNNDEEEGPFYPTCRIYMAPSSLGDDAGYGIFTVEDVPKGHDILRNDGPNIPVIIDLDHIKSITSSGQKLKGKQGNPLTLWHNVWWGTHGGMDDRMMYEVPPIDSNPDSGRSNDNATSSRNRLRIYDFQPTFGALPNHHEFRSNLKHRQPTVVYDDSIMMKKKKHHKNMKNETVDDGSRYYYPGRGAVSYYKGKHFMADTDIVAGSEIFLNYGPNFLPSRGIDFAHIPRERDYYTAARLVRTIFLDPRSVALSSSFSSQRSLSELIVAMLLYATEYTTLELNETTRQKISATTNDDEILILLRSSFLTLDRQVQMKLIDVGDEDEKSDFPQYRMQRVMSLFPKTMNELHSLLQTANRTFQEELDELEWDLDDLDDDKDDNDNDDETEIQEWWTYHLAEAIYTEISVVRRTPDFIRQNGMCSDNIIPRKSSIVEGMGAVAQRSLKKGQMIVPVPLLHLSNRALFSRPTISVNDASSSTELSAMQYYDELIVNYCYSHDETTMLLCPVTNAMFINHCSDRFPDRCRRDKRKGPNAKLEWATDATTTKSLTESFDEIEQSIYERKVSFSIIATRDIDEGEEIFIDYGQSWEEAWDDHVKSWTNNLQQGGSSSGGGGVSSSGSISCTSTEMEMNQINDLSPYFGDLRGTSSYLTPDGRFMTMCWNRYGSTLDDMWRDNTTDWKTIVSDDDILVKYAVDGRDILYTNGDYGSWFPCSIIASDDSDEGQSASLGQQKNRTAGSSYIVRIFFAKVNKRREVPVWHERGIPRIYHHFPRSSIRFFTTPLMSDQHYYYLSSSATTTRSLPPPRPFRHHIGIPDEIFPPQWKNKQQ